MSRKGEIGSAMALKKSKKRKSDSPLFVAAKRPSTSTPISTPDIKVQHQKKKGVREVGSKRNRSKEAGRNSSPENEERKDKMNEMKAQVKEMKAFVQDIRTQMDFDRRLVLEAEEIAEEFSALLAQLIREKNKLQVSKILWDQLLADYLQFIILSLP